MPAPTRKPAAKSTTAAAPAANDLSKLLAGVTVATEPPKRRSSSKPVLTLAHVQQSLNEGKPFSYPPMDADTVEEVKSDLQRAANKLGCGVSKSAEDQGNGTFVLTFQATADKRKRAYTSDDIRLWAKDTKGLDIPKTTKIPEDVRKAFRVAKGYDKPSDSAADKSYAKSDQD